MGDAIGTLAFFVIVYVVISLFIDVMDGVLATVAAILSWLDAQRPFRPRLRLRRRASVTSSMN